MAGLRRRAAQLRDRRERTQVSSRIQTKPVMSLFNHLRLQVIYGVGIMGVSTRRLSPHPLLRARNLLINYAM